MKWSNGENILYFPLAVSVEGQPDDRRISSNFFTEINMLVALSACATWQSRRSDWRHSRRQAKSIGRARERWPAGSRHHRTDILALMEPGEGRTGRFPPEAGRATARAFLTALAD